MKHRFFVIAVVFAWIGTLSIVPAMGADVEFEPIKGWNGHLFPSYLIATAVLKDADENDDSDMESEEAAEADDDDSDDSDDDAETLGHERGVLGVTIQAAEDDQEVTVTIISDLIMQSSVFTCTLPKKGETYLIKPNVRYKYDELAKRTQTGPIAVTYKVESGDDEDEKTEMLTLRSINDCPYSILKDGEWTNIRYMYAAYVNEQHPFVDKILREALDTEIVDSFTGYQSKDKAQVYRQAYALWHALSQRGVRYSSITKTAAISDSVGSQHVRLLDESIDNAQANCVDGSALFASLLRKINIEPLLVHVPGHCYLAFYLDAEGKDLVGLETTIIGSQIEDDAISVKGLEEVADEDSQAENSWKTFAAAVARGTANLKKFDNEFKDQNNQNYKLISIAEARKSGILPIGFLAKKDFIQLQREKTEY